jgi:hypothetical protein
MSKQRMHYRDFGNKELAQSIESMIPMAFMCLVAQQPDGVFRLKIDDLDELPKGKVMEMELEQDTRTFIFKVVKK